MVWTCDTEEGNDAGSEREAKARTAKNNMEEAGGRECEESQVEDQEAAEGMRCIRPPLETRKEQDRNWM